MNQPTDEMVAELLRDTFTAHEHLANPDRARALVPMDPQPGRARLGLVAAAVAAVVVAGVVLVPRGDNAQEPSDPGPTGPTSALPDPDDDAARVRAENRASRLAAVSEAERVLASMPVFEGAEGGAASDVPPLARQMTSLGGTNKSVVRTGFWIVEGNAAAIADWYSLHPPAGMATDGGPHAVGGSRNSDGSWSEEVLYGGRRGGPSSHSSALVQVTALPLSGREAAGVRIDVYTTWEPARPLASFTPDDVTAVRIVFARRNNSPSNEVGTTSKIRVTVTDPGDVARLRDAYDALPGTHGLPHGCPYLPDLAEYRLTFVSATREVRTEHTGYCWPTWSVWVDDERLQPAVEDTGELTAAIERALR